MCDIPFFSVIIPCYNRGHLIERPIQSVLQQTERDFELIVIDDGSTDNTKQVIDAIQDRRIRYFFQENAERGAARNHGVRKATGKFVTFLDSDDLLYTNHLEEAKRFLTNNITPFYFQPYHITDESGNEIRKIPRIENDVNMMLVKKGNFMSCHGIFIDRQLAVKNPFNEDRILAGSEDYELWLRLAARFSLQAGQKITAALVQHNDRSVFNFKPERLINRKMKFLEVVQGDKVFMNKYGRYFNRIRSGAFSYIAIHLPLKGRVRRLRFEYLNKAIAAYPRFIFTKRFLVIIRQIFLKR